MIVDITYTSTHQSVLFKETNVDYQVCHGKVGPVKFFSPLTSKTLRGGMDGTSTEEGLLKREIGLLKREIEDFLL